MRTTNLSKSNNVGFSKLMKLLDRDFIVSECVLFSHRVSRNGYSRLRLGKKNINAHRFAFYWYNTIPINQEKCIMHSCDNPACVNPLHLSEGTWDDNNKDRAAKGRTVVFSFFRRKLTPEDVVEIKAAFMYPKKGLLKSLVEKYKVDANVIYKARDGKYDDWTPPSTLKEKRATLLISPKQNS